MNVKVGDWVNDWDYKFPSGRVMDVDPDGKWFEVAWERGGVKYVKRHEAGDLAAKPVEGRLVKV
jgi:hypothetical protein